MPVKDEGSDDKLGLKREVESIGIK